MASCTRARRPKRRASRTTSKPLSPRCRTWRTRSRRAQQQQLAEAADQNAADAARKAATLAQAQYRLGTVDFLTVLDAQRTLYQAEDTLVQARLARLQASVSLFRAFGGGFGVTDSSTASSSTPSRS
ncbi:hypothetical protein BZM27_51900 [Paraburkholderia steynii]|uniref:RND transporter n=1 Tax=Paraburkholderia steynii TaxID=1245441 RepID=A0A4R0X2T1_9BURK|nr:hypothetical protein BZM27_51900 [Paraburkholderia steynii]